MQEHPSYSNPRTQNQDETTCNQPHQQSDVLFPGLQNQLGLQRSHLWVPGFLRYFLLLFRFSLGRPAITNPGLGTFSMGFGVRWLKAFWDRDSMPAFWTFRPAASLPFRKLNLHVTIGAEKIMGHRFLPKKGFPCLLCFRGGTKTGVAGVNQPNSR